MKQIVLDGEVPRGVFSGSSRGKDEGQAGEFRGDRKKENQMKGLGRSDFESATCKSVGINY